MMNEKEVLDYIERLETESFDGWTYDQIQGYMTALISVKEFILSKSSNKETNIDFSI